MSATEPCTYEVGQVVKWRGQYRECSGKIVDIMRPENSGYVLVLDIGDGVDMFVLPKEVTLVREYTVGSTRDGFEPPPEE